ncbi:HORMA domain-containing protein 1 [Coemansia javaensis]|uniref:HORMA domain-containing protein 1 n=1 Tax=Coemansia javaensis TaxID=2761396 RepID=A0A9W8LKG1_9FUNG|nr:HORMA domain-containing protein 1 [Coemansia javaensis]
MSLSVSGSGAAMSVSAKMYISDVLYIALSEIAYYRYLLPASFFDEAWFEGIDVHRIRAGQSAESDQLLEILRGACDCMSRGYLRSLAFGLSVHPDDALYIRELYAFQFEASAVAGNKAGRARDAAGSGRDLLHRLVLLLQEMEASRISVVKTHISARIVLVPGAPAGYAPPSFLPLGGGSGAGCYAVMPQFGSAQVGRMDKAGAAVQLCVLSVEGPAQDPPLGSTKCPAPVQMSIDDDPGARVFAAVPSIAAGHGQTVVTRGQQKKQLLGGNGAAAGQPGPRRPGRPARGSQPPRDVAATAASGGGCECQIGGGGSEAVVTCYRCKRACHAQCYALDGGPAPLPLVCATCQAAGAGAGAGTHAVTRLALARRAAAFLCRGGDGLVFSLLKDVGCTRHRGRAVIAALQALGLMRIVPGTYPRQFTVAPDSRAAAQASLFSDDILTALAAASE